MDDREKKRSLTVVAENSSEALEKRRARDETQQVKLRAAGAVKQLAVNLLRVIAGAGEPLNLLRDIDNARALYVDYISAARSADQQVHLPIEGLDLNSLFSSPRREHEPTTEEDWRRWAQPSDPYEEHFRYINHAKLELRRAILRQVASVLSSGETREPHLQAHGGNLDDIIKDICSAHRQFANIKSQPRKPACPERLAIAEGKIAELRHEKRIQQIRSLPAHQIAGLVAVEAGTVEQTDSFTLDTLGRMELLRRPKGRKSKADWQLTDDGLLALKIHKGHKQ